MLYTFCKSSVRTEIFLELWIERDVARIVEEQIELNLVVTGSCEQRRVKRVGFRRHQGLFAYAVDVLELGRLGFEEFTKRRAIGFSGLPPVLLDRIPAVA